MSDNRPAYRLTLQHGDRLVARIADLEAFMRDSFGAWSHDDTVWVDAINENGSPLGRLPVGQVVAAIPFTPAPEPSSVTVNRGFSARGFKHYEPIETDYGDVVKVYESSAAGDPHLWLAIDATRRTPPPSGDSPELTAHLDVEGTKRLIATLQAGLANHYQRDGAT